MDTAKNKCIWASQCGEDGCEDCCEYYYPLDGSVEEQEYESILKEDTELYQSYVNMED